MNPISKLLDVQHDNIYVRAEKIRKSIDTFKAIKANQLHSNIIQVPFNDIKSHLSSLESQHKQVWKEIRTLEQCVFAFGS